MTLPGIVEVATVPDGILVQRADERVLISRELWEQALRGETEHLIAGEGLFRIEALNGHWTYRITDDRNPFFPNALIAQRVSVRPAAKAVSERDSGA